jgi:hypothetical protein
MTKLRLATLAALPLVLTACGQSYDSVTDLKDALIEAGLDCDVFQQVEPSGRSSGHGSCSPEDEDLELYGFGMDIYPSEEDTTAAVASWDDVPIPYCLAYGEDWSVSFNTGDTSYDRDNCDLVADRLGGAVKQGDGQ